MIKERYIGIKDVTLQGIYRKRMTKLVKIVSGVVAVAALVAGYGAYLLFSSPYKMAETAYIYVDEDDTMDSLKTKVVAATKAESMNGFDLMTKLKRFNKPRTGRYSIQPGENIFNSVRKIANGIQEPALLTIPEVRTVEAMVERIAPQLMISAEDIQKELDDPQVIAELGYTKETLPCLFVPNTYEIYWNTSAKNLLTRLNKERQSLWNADRQAKAKAMGLTPEEVTTLASIVESETAYGPEKATVAGLYYNRLKINMPLQSDPTVIFAVGDFTIRRVLNEHLNIDSPYNTYKNTGLPPGPIRIPSIQGIDAVLNYGHNDYLYMCAKEDFSGSHNFTSSYAQHLANAVRYQRALNQRGIMK